MRTKWKKVKKYRAGAWTKPRCGTSKNYIRNAKKIFKKKKKLCYDYCDLVISLFCDRNCVKHGRFHYFSSNKHTLTKKKFSGKHNYRDWNKEKFIFSQIYIYFTELRNYLSRMEELVRGTSWKLSNKIFRWTIYDDADYFMVYNHETLEKNKFYFDTIEETSEK